MRWIAYERNIAGDIRLVADVDANHALVGDRVVRARQARVVRLDRLSDEGIGLRCLLPKQNRRNCCRVGCAVNRQQGPAGEGGRIHGVREDLPVVPEDAQINDDRGEIAANARMTTRARANSTRACPCSRSRLRPERSIPVPPVRLNGVLVPRTSPYSRII